MAVDLLTVLSLLSAILAIFFGLAGIIGQSKSKSGTLTAWGVVAIAGIVCTQILSVATDQVKSAQERTTTNTLIANQLKSIFPLHSVRVALITRIDTGDLRAQPYRSRVQPLIRDTLLRHQSFPATSTVNFQGYAQYGTAVTFGDGSPLMPAGRSTQRGSAERFIRLLMKTMYTYVVGYRSRRTAADVIRPEVNPPFRNFDWLVALPSPYFVSRPTDVKHPARGDFQVACWEAVTSCNVYYYNEETGGAPMLNHADANVVGLGDLAGGRLFVAVECPKSPTPPTLDLISLTLITDSTPVIFPKTWLHLVGPIKVGDVYYGNYYYIDLPPIDRFATSLPKEM